MRPKHLGPYLPLTLFAVASTLAQGTGSITPDPHACAELASMRQRAQQGLQDCDIADYPDEQRPRCRAQMQGLVKDIEKIEQTCKK